MHPEWIETTLQLSNKIKYRLKVSNVYGASLDGAKCSPAEADHLPRNVFIHFFLINLQYVDS